MSENLTNTKRGLKMLLLKCFGSQAGEAIRQATCKSCGLKIFRGKVSMSEWTEGRLVTNSCECDAKYWPSSMTIVPEGALFVTEDKESRA